MLLLTWWCIRFLFWNGGLYFSYYNNILTSIIHVNGQAKSFMIEYYSHDSSHVTFSCWYRFVITYWNCCDLFHDTIIHIIPFRWCLWKICILQRFDSRHHLFILHVLLTRSCPSTIFSFGNATMHVRYLLGYDMCMRLEMNILKNEYRVPGMVQVLYVQSILRTSLRIFFLFSLY